MKDYTAAVTITLEDLEDLVANLAAAVSAYKNFQKGDALSKVRTSDFEKALVRARVLLKKARETSE